VVDQPVHQLAGVGRVSDDAIGRAVGVDRERVLAEANIIDAAQAERFQMLDKIAVAGAWLREGAYAAQVRNQWHDGSPWRRVEVSLAAFEFSSLAHLGRAR
jgi:hypothetical protein